MYKSNAMQRSRTCSSPNNTTPDQGRRTTDTRRIGNNLQCHRQCDGYKARLWRTTRTKLRDWGTNFG